MSILGSIIIGFVFGILFYDMLADRRIIMATVKGFVDVREGFRKTREEINKKK